MAQTAEFLPEIVKDISGPDPVAAREAEIVDIENHLLQGIFACRTKEAVEASLTYAEYLSSVGITPENYPVFLRMLEIENHWVVDALIGDRNPFLLLSGVQPNKFIVGRILAMMTRWHKGGIYPKNLSVILGVLQSVYSSPRDGYRIYPLSIADTNALGKHLDKDKGQDSALNRAILDVLDKISALEDAGDAEMEEVAIHASAIRNAFFDDRKRMEDVIPPVLLVSVDSRDEIAPRGRRPVGQRAPVSTTTEAEPEPRKSAAKKASTRKSATKRNTSASSTSKTKRKASSSKPAAKAKASVSKSAPKKNRASGQKSAKAQSAKKKK